MPRKRADSEALLVTAEEGIHAESNPESLAGQNGDAASERWQRIALAAYYRAEQRGFADGNELEDWLAAENEVQ